MTAFPERSPVGDDDDDDDEDDDDDDDDDTRGRAAWTGAVE